MPVEDKFNINLNQNLWGIVVCYGALGVAEHWKLCVLFWMSAISSAWMTISVMITFAAYTWNYCKKKAS